MADPSNRAAGIFSAVALSAGCLLATPVGAAQTLPTVSLPVVLDARAATRLLLKQVSPEYPPLAKYNFIQGRVRLQVIVTRDGQVRKAHVIEGHPFLAAAALSAVRHWVFRPLMTSAGAVEFLTSLDVKFALRSRKIDEIPLQAEADLERQVRLPEVLQGPLRQAGSSNVRLRVLVDDRGKVIDWQPIGGLASGFATAGKNVRQWTFRPARWGTLSVPWYLDIDVPTEDARIPQAAGDPSCR